MGPCTAAAGAVDGGASTSALGAADVSRAEQWWLCRCAPLRKRLDGHRRGAQVLELLDEVLSARHEAKASLAPFFSRDVFAKRQDARSPLPVCVRGGGSSGSIVPRAGAGRRRIAASLGVGKPAAAGGAAREHVGAWRRSRGPGRAAHVRGEAGRGPRR